MRWRTREKSLRGKSRLRAPSIPSAPGAERLVQPALRIVAKAAKQHQIRAAGNNVDGIDLQQGHLLNGLQNIAGLCATTGLFQQPLRGKVEMAGFFKREGNTDMQLLR
jgi:hypothetical protein